MKPIHPKSIPQNSAQATRVKKWRHQLSLIVIRIMKCEDVDDFNAIQVDAFAIREDMERYAEEYRACDVASRRLTEAFEAENKQHTLERLTEVGMWLSLGMSPELAAN